MEGAAIRSALRPSNRLIPLRHWISQRLDEFYAQPASAVVGSGAATLHELTSPPKLGAIWNDSQWQRIVHRLYKQQQGRWLTPVELFQPYYSSVVTDFIVQAFQSSKSTSSQPSTHAHKSLTTNNQYEPLTDRGHSEYPTILDVVEWGGGRGTNAHLIMDRLRDVYPSVYERVRYTLLDASPTLLEVQLNRLDNAGHGNKVNCIQMNVLDVAERASHTSDWLPPISTSTGNQSSSMVMIALELLDNLSHDKVRYRPQHQGPNRRIDTSVSAWEHAHVAVNEVGEPIEEVFTSVDDPLLIDLIPLWLGTMNAVHDSTTAFWIPTAALGMLRRLREERPHAHLLVADFDWLPPPDRLAPASHIKKKQSLVQRAWGDPLITCMEGFDHENYLYAPRCSDILFPTDFHRLSMAIRHLWQHSALVGSPVPPSPILQVMKQPEFLQRYGPNQVKATRHWLTGYTPLLADFDNCSVLTLAPCN